MEIYILKNNDNKYFYDFKNFLDSPEFGEFNLGKITTFETLEYALNCKANIESLSDMQVSVEKMSISITTEC